MKKSTSPTPPRKPRPDFPLFAHHNGSGTFRWAKKINGRLHHFGPGDDPDGALKRYLDQRDDLRAGRTPRVQKQGLTVRDLINEFLNSKRLLLEARELTARSWRDYHVSGLLVARVLGKTRIVADLDAADFDRLKAELAKGRSPVTVGNEVGRIRVIFRWAYEQGLIDKPVRFGPGFKRPSKATLRRERAKRGRRMFEPEQLRKMIEAAPMPLRAMILLAVNTGCGNSDLAGLEHRHLDLAASWLTFPRPKTGIARRCALWPETVAALRAAIAARPAPKREEDAECVFLTLRGERVVRIIDNPEKPGAKVDAVTREFGKLLDALKMKRDRLGFYTLRHVFATIAGRTRDEVAVRIAMGHQDHSIADAYREEVDDSRLRAVADVVRAWLWPAPRPEGAEPAILPFQATAS
jgi:integrase